MRRTVVVLLAVGTVLTMLAAVIGVIRPSFMVAGVSEAAVRPFVWAYAVRALPLGAILLALLFGRPSAALGPMLLLAGVVQAGDVLIGAAYGVPGMILGGGLMTVLYLYAAWAVRPARRPAAAVV
ncbi:DUF4267 domain-containing protein [Hamadaea tsunoensis]|uniref:DUF4267 domain-containing protein n=1 Tax=Hamadaea tsunoensis TaxID=53368 RepID=UPI00042920A3|nr:DUF4267 domain-containing protein [Hamadaea tsunoensis]